MVSPKREIVIRCQSTLFGILLSFCFSLQAQVGPPGGLRGSPGGPPRAPFAGKMKELFGENSAFTANMHMETKTQGGSMSVPAKLSFLDGKSRFEMDMTKAKGAAMPPGVAEQMKAMGMGEMISITRPEKKESYIIYPGLKAYAVTPATDEDTATAGKEQIKKTELGKETVDGHPTTKYKMLMKDADGKEQEATLWSASDLKDFPVKIEMSTEAGPSMVTFSDVRLGKPDESLFDPPSGFQRYNDVSTMMREAMMKRFAPPGGGAFPLAPPNK